jgi:hypothetical protein
VTSFQESTIFYGGKIMKHENTPFFLIAFLITLFSGCREDSIQVTNNEQIPELSGQLTSHSACKGSQAAVSSIDTRDSSSCVEYSFDAVNHKLTLKHINAGFNCCPESLYCLIRLRSDTIFVEEHEKIPACLCDCLFDLNMEIQGVVAKKYYLRFIEPYCGDQEKLYFDVDLNRMPNGTFCVKRTGYPWGGG